MPSAGACRGGAETGRGGEQVQRSRDTYLRPVCSSPAPGRGTSACAVDVGTDSPAEEREEQSRQLF